MDNHLAQLALARTNLTASSHMRGVGKPIDVVVQAFIQTYAAFIFRRVAPCQVPPLTGVELVYTCMHSKNCPTGMGQCAAQEFPPFSDLAFDILAGILYAIKNCVPWPKGLLLAKAVWR